MMKNIKFYRFQIIKQVRRGTEERRFRVKAKILGFLWIVLADCKGYNEAEQIVLSRSKGGGSVVEFLYQELPARGDYMDVYILTYCVRDRKGRIYKHVEKYSTGWNALLHKWIAEKFEKEKKDISLYVETVKLKKYGSKRNKKD